MLRVRLQRAGSVPGACSGQAGKDADVGALLQRPPGHSSSLRSAASAPLTPSPRILLSLPRSSRRLRRKQSRFLKSWGREDFRAMGSQERQASGHQGWKPGHRQETPDPDARSWWEHMLRPQRSSLRRGRQANGVLRAPPACSPELSSRLQSRLLRWMEAPPVFSPLPHLLAQQLGATGRLCSFRRCPTLPRNNNN